MLRIELYEKHCSHTEEEREHHEYIMGKEMKVTYYYSRINPRLCDISYPREINGSTTECQIVFKGLNGTEGHTVTVLGSYDDICIQLNDIENNKME